MTSIAFLEIRWFIRSKDLRLCDNASCEKVPAAPHSAAWTSVAEW
jgi:hypothetical protein